MNPESCCMRAVVVIAVLTVLPPLSFGAKLALEDRVELTRGLVAEYATVKVLLPRSKKPLEFESKGTYDKKAWSEIAKGSGPAARSGDSCRLLGSISKPIASYCRSTADSKAAANGTTASMSGWGPPPTRRPCPERQRFQRARRHLRRDPLS